MSRSHALSADLDYPAEKTLPVRGPRSADAIDAPIGSPVHALQEQLQRLEATDGLEQTGSSSSRKLPGWIRLTVPVALSMVLWAVILQATGMLD